MDDALGAVDELDDARVTRLTTAVLARNEAGEDRYLRRVLTHCKSFSDDVVVLDDNSDDNTAKVAESLGCHVAIKNAGGGFWGSTETPARRLLWELGSRIAGDGWLLVCDADQLLRGDVRALCESWDCAAWAMPLVDCWDGEDQFRVDGPWGLSPRNPRPWLFRPSALQVAPIWRESCLHTGHCPENFSEAGPTFIAPPDTFWVHLGYARREHRLRKHAAYLSVADRLSPFELMHAQSIADV